MALTGTRGGLGWARGLLLLGTSEDQYYLVFCSILHTSFGFLIFFFLLSSLKKTFSGVGGSWKIFQNFEDQRVFWNF